MRKATLTIEGQSYDLLGVSYSFGRDTDVRGRPTSGCRGGDIHVVMESTSDTSPISLMIDDDPKRCHRRISGRIEVTDIESGMILRQHIFDEAYINTASEQMTGLGSLPMTQTFTICPQRLDINKFIRIDRRTSSNWQRYKESEPVEIFVRQEPKKIVDMYWSYGPNHVRLSGGARSRHYADLNLHIITENHDNGDTLNITVESDSGDALYGSSKQMTLSGRVNDNSLIFENVFQTVNLNL
jgi:hypothetical protein